MSARGHHLERQFFGTTYTLLSTLSLNVVWISMVSCERVLEMHKSFTCIWVTAVLVMYRHAWLLTQWLSLFNCHIYTQECMNQSMEL